VVLTSPEAFKGGSSRTSDSGGMDHIFSYPMFRRLEKQPQGVTGVAAFYQFGANLLGGCNWTSATVTAQSRRATRTHTDWKVRVIVHL